MARILLAEGNLALRQLIKGLIETHSGWYVCGEVADGHEAVSKTFELKPDLVVLDFAMSGLNGLQAAGRILNMCPGLPIILHTFHGFPVMVAEAKKVGIRAVVGKEETAERLLDTIETHLNETPNAAANLLIALTQPLANEGTDDAEIPDDSQKTSKPN